MKLNISSALQNFVSGLEGVKTKLSALVFNPGLAEDQEGGIFQCLDSGLFMMTSELRPC